MATLPCPFLPFTQSNSNSKSRGMEARVVVLWAELYSSVLVRCIGLFYSTRALINPKIYRNVWRDYNIHLNSLETYQPCAML